MKESIKTLFPVCAFVLAFSAGASAQVMLPARSLVEGKLPSGVIDPITYPVRFTDENHLLLFDPSTRTEKIYDFTKESITGSRPAPDYGYDTEIHVAPDPFGSSRYDGDIEDAVNPYYSPDRQKVAFVRGNDLYVKELKTGAEKRLTFDGAEHVMNGYSSWVYNEEIIGRPTRYKAFWWSPDSKKLAFMHTDDNKVHAFHTYDSRGHFGEWVEWRYAQAGDTNPEVSLYTVSVEDAFKTNSQPDIVKAKLDESRDHYIGTPYWSSDSKRLLATWMNRDQNHFEILSVSPVDGRADMVYSEDQKTWIDWPEGIATADDGFYIVRDFSLYQQVYFIPYSAAGYYGGYKQLTDGTNWGITMVKMDKKHLYYTARRDFSTVNQLYRVNLKGAVRNTECLTLSDYDYTDVVVSPKGTKFAARYSNVHTPVKVVGVSNGKDADSWLIADSRGDKYYDYLVAEGDIVYYATSDGLRIPAKVVWPLNMDKSKKYPVIVEVYGGPSNSVVMNEWSKPSFSNQWWAQNGVIQIWLDNRASGHLGKRYVNQIYRQLTRYELKDFCDAVKWFEQTYPFIDAAKVGIEGYSYGGSMTVLACSLGNEYFKYGIAGSGVYDWALYDSHYTERYMDTPQDNPDGYKDNSVINNLDKYVGDDSNMLFLSHGTLDDNVHFQSTLQLVRKLQADGKKFEMMLYPEGFHGYRGDQHKFWVRDNMEFWYKYLLGKPLPAELDY